MMSSVFCSLANTKICFDSKAMKNTTPEQQNSSFLSPLGNFFAIFYCYFIFLDKKKSPEILVQLNLGLCDILGRSIFFSTQIFHLILIV